MNLSDEKLEMMLRLVRESAQLDDMGASSPRRSACLSMSRLAALTHGGLQPDVEERAHLRHCRLCALRYGAMQSVAAPITQRSRAQRWLTRLTGIAAAALLALALWPALQIGVVPDSVPDAVGPRHAPTLAGHALHPSPAMASALSCVPCDANCDGWFDPLDVDAFILVLTDPRMFAREFPSCDNSCGIDLDGDGRIDRNDVEPFVACMLAR